MKNQLLLLLLFLLTPLTMYAGPAAGQPVHVLIVNITNFLGGTLINFLLAVALLAFVINVARYFIIGGADEQARGRAKQYIIYSVAGLVFIGIIWAVVNLLVTGLGFDQPGAETLDYQENYRNKLR